MKAAMKLVMLLSLLTTLTEGRGTLSMCTAHSNGCSIPFNLTFFYKTLFTPSCDQHDNCYRCGSIHGLTKATCDQWFLDAMLAACAVHDAGKRDLHLDRDKRSPCTVVAHTYYQAVNLAGGSHYHATGTTEGFCVSDARTVNSCLGI